MRPHDIASPLQVMRVMLTALAILFLGVSVFAYAWGGQSLWSVHAPGDDDPTGMLHELRREGMDCRPRPQATGERPEMFDCQYRQPGVQGPRPRAWDGMELAAR
jgi:hypothetical protein